MGNSRLPEFVIPLNYKINFDIDFKKFVFIGNEEIALKTIKPTNKIILNSSGLKIDEVNLFFRGKVLKPKINLDEKNEQLVLKFGEKLSGSMQLSINFTGKLVDSLSGFYRSKYIDKNGKEKYLATTQFEAPYARKAFPCFDEPQYKATFDITLKIDKNLQAISNMSVKKTKVEGSKKIVQFYRTPKMSSYLVYLGVGDFEFVKSKLGRTLLRVVTTKGKKNQGKFALDVAKKILAYFENYSGIKYPLPKLDLIAIPDFAAGAMENWGAITFREAVLLYDSKLTSVATKRNIAMVVAHEIWHQWSGNLVTMKWWNDLWLNESFATFMAYKAVDFLFPEWNIWEDFILEETMQALEEDCLKSTHPISVDVKDVRQIEEIFDSISYGKGGSVLRMLENYLGEENFQKGVSAYLSKFKYGNATSTDLWDSFSKISGKQIRKIMSAWVEQSGYPFVEAVEDENKILLKQKRFVFNKNDEKTIWPIPISIKLANNEEVKKLFERKTDFVLLKQKPRWFKMNVNQSGFYRVKYSEKNLFQLKYLIYNKILSPIDRWGIESDLFEFCMMNLIELASYLKFVKVFKTEDNYLTLFDIALSMKQIYFVFFDELINNNLTQKFNEHLKEPFRRILDKVGFEPKIDEDEKTSLLRELALSFLIFVEDADVIKFCFEKFEEYVKKKIKLNPNISAPVFYSAAVVGGKKNFESILKIYKRTESLDEKIHALSALGKFKDTKILLRTLNFSLTDKVRLQDVATPIASVASNPYARKILFGWMKKNWKKIEDIKKRAPSIFMKLLSAFVIAHIGKENEKRLRKFFATHPVEYKLILEKSFEKMQRNTLWHEKNKESLLRYFSK